MTQYVIYDTEFTAWPGSMASGWQRPGELKEIIQIGAVKVEQIDKHLEIIGSLNVLIKPTHNPILSDYIQELTGIHQTLCDEHGIDFHSAADQFQEFIESGKIRCLSWGSDAAVLMENYKLNDLSWPFEPSLFIDLRERVKSAGLSEHNLCSGELAASVGLVLNGHLHNALYDVKSIFAFINHKIESGELSTEILN